MSSPFEKVPRSEWIAENELAFAIRDAGSLGSKSVLKDFGVRWFCELLIEHSASQPENRSSGLRNTSTKRE